MRGASIEIEEPKRIEQSKLITLRISLAEWETIKERANRFAGGNFSAWLRIAALNYLPLALALPRRREHDPAQ